ncbi:MAG: DUF2336 domain-containing protein [Reyranella sp.]
MSDSGGVGDLNLQGLKTADFLRAEGKLTPEQKSGLATHLAAKMDPSRLSAEDFANAEAILRLLVWNSEAHVVEVLARVAAANPHTPKSIAWALANDEEAAAAPILESSTALTDSDLVAIVESSDSPSKMGAIARRATVSAEVSRSLAEKGDESAVRALLANPNAVVPEDATERVRNRFSESSEMRNAIAAWKERSMPLATPPGYVDIRTQDELDARFAQLKAQKSLNEFLLVGELCLGNFDFFCRALAALAKASGDDVCAAVARSPVTELPAFWARAGLPIDWLPIARAAVTAVTQIDAEVGKSDRQIFARNIVDRTLTLLRADKITLNDAQRRFFVRQGGR